METEIQSEVRPSLVSVIPLAMSFIASFALVASSLVHLSQPYVFASVAGGYQVFPTSMLVWGGSLIASLQFAFALELFFRCRFRNLVIAAIVFGAFFMLQGQSLLRGLDIGCGCFGYSPETISATTMALPGALSIGCIIAAAIAHKHASDE